MKNLHFQTLKTSLIVVFCLATTFVSRAQQHYKFVTDTNSSNHVLITESIDKGFLVYSGANYSAYVSKFDSLLNFKWLRTTVYQHHDVGKRVIEDLTGNVFLPGIEFGPLLEEDFTITKFDSSGNFLAFINGKNLPDEEYIVNKDFKFDRVNNRLLLIYYYYDTDSSGNIEDHSNLLVMDNNFNIIWSKRIDAAYFDKIFPVYDNSGGVNYLLYNSPDVIKFDASGTVIWTKRFLNAGTIIDIVQKDSSYYFMTTEISNTGSVIIKTDLSGTVITSVIGSPADSVFSQSIKLDKNGVITACFYKWTLGNPIITFSDNLNVIQSVTDLNGNNGIIEYIDDANNFYLSGRQPYPHQKKIYIEKMNMNSSCNFANSSYVFTPSSSIYDSLISNPVFIAARPLETDINTISSLTPHFYFECLGTSVSNISESPSDLAVFPNPTRDNIRVITPTSIEKTELKIFDCFGKLVLNQNYYTEQTLNISHLQPGLYIANLIDKERLYSTKFIKE